MKARLFLLALCVVMGSAAPSGPFGPDVSHYQVRPAVGPTVSLDGFLLLCGPHDRSIPWISSCCLTGASHPLFSFVGVCGLDESQGRGSQVSPIPEDKCGWGRSSPNTVPDLFLPLSGCDV